MAIQTVKVEGLSELQRAMDMLPVEIRRGGLIVRALRRAGAIVRDAARRMAPVLPADEETERRKSGAIRANIVSYVTGQFDGMITAIIRVRSRGYIFENAGFRRRRDAALAGNPNYWWLVEFGTSDTRAQPFMRPAFMSTRDAALDMIKTGLRDEIMKAARRWARKHAK